MQTQSQQAFQKLLGVLQQADQSFLAPNKQLDQQGMVDGYRHLAHLLSYGIDFYLENDPLRPHFTSLASKTRKILGDNVDSRYYFTQVRGDQVYKIKGKRRNSCYLSFAIYGGKPDGSMSDHVVNTINHTHIQFDEEGNFEITLTANPQNEQEFQMDADSICMISREYFYDPNDIQEADLSIENLSELSPVTGPISDEELATRFNAVATFIQHTLFIVPFPMQLPVNNFSPAFPFPKTQKSWGLTDNIYCFGKFKLADDECLEITFNSPECVYWGIQSWNYLMQSMDYRYHQVSINNKQAQAEEDGSYKIILSKQQLDKPNSFCSGGYAEGVVFCRWLLAEGMPAQPKIEVKKI